MKSATDLAALEPHDQELDAQDAFTLFGLPPDDRAFLQEVPSHITLIGHGELYIPNHKNANLFGKHEGPEYLEDPNGRLPPFTPPDPKWNPSPVHQTGDNLDSDEMETYVVRPIHTFKWQDLSHVGKSVVLRELSDYHGSFQKACEVLLLLRDDVEKWMHAHRAELGQERCWKLQLVRWKQQSTGPLSDEDAQNVGPVEMELLTNREMHKAAIFVNDIGYPHISDRIRAWSHKKVAWPLPIDISTYQPHKIQDGNAASIGQVEHGFGLENFVDDIEEEDESAVGRDVPNADPVRVVYSVALTGPQIKVKNTIRLLTCVLPKETVVIGPAGRQVLTEAGEYRVCPPPQQQSPFEVESQLDFVTDDPTLTSIIRQNFQNQNQRAPSKSNNVTGGITENNANNEDESLLLREEQNDGTDAVDTRSEFEKIMDNILATPDHVEMNDWSMPDNSSPLHPPQSQFFVDATAALDWPSPRLPTQIVPVNHNMGPAHKDDLTFAVRVAQANQKREAETQPHIDGTRDPLNMRVDLDTLERSLAEGKPEEALEQALLASMAPWDPAQSRQRILDRVYQSQKGLYESLNPSRLILESPFIEPRDFSPVITETCPSGSRPDANISGPVEKARTPAVVDDPLDLAFMTIPIAPGYRIISPTGYIMNFDTGHRGPIDGSAPTGQGGTYSFFLPEMAKQLPEDFRPWLHDWIGFRIFHPQQFGLLLNGRWLGRWATAGMHQIAEIDGELDLLNTEGRYRVFNDMLAIGTPIKGKTSNYDTKEAIRREAQSIIAPYKQFLRREEEAEKLEEAAAASADELALKKAHEKDGKRRLKEHLKKMASEKEKERRSVQEDTKSQDAQPLGRGNRLRRPTARYSELGMVSFTGDVEKLLEEEASDSNSLSDEEEYKSEDGHDEGDVKVEPQKKHLVVVLRVPDKSAMVTSQPSLPVSTIGTSNAGKSQSKEHSNGKNKSTPNAIDTSRIGNHDKGKKAAPTNKPPRAKYSMSKQADSVPFFDGPDDNNVGGQRPQPSGAKRTVSTISGDEAVMETPTKKRRGRPRKKSNELSRPRKQDVTTLSSVAIAKQASPPNAASASTCPVPQQKREPAAYIQTPAPLPVWNSATVVQEPKVVPESSQNTLLKSQPKSTLLPARLPAFLPQQAQDMTTSVKMPTKPKYDLKPARKAASYVSSPDRSSALYSMPLRPTARILTTPQQEQPNPMRGYNHKPKLEFNTTSTPGNAAVPPTAMPVTSPTPNLAAMTNRHYTSNSPAASMTAPKLHQWPELMNPLSSSTSAGLSQQYLPWTQPPMPYRPILPAPSQSQAANVTPNTPLWSTTPRPFTTVQIPESYPSPIKQEDGRTGYRSLAGKIHSDFRSAIQADQGRGLIDMSAATMALVRATKRHDSNGYSRLF